MQLFYEGNPQIDSLTQGMKVVLNRPVVLDEPILQGESDADASGVTIYGTVLRDGGGFRMWYQAWPRSWDGTDSIGVGHAESSDGLRWRRSDCGLVECNGSSANNLTDLPFHSPSVVIDPDANPAGRYRAFGYTEPGRLRGRYPHHVNGAGYYTARSSDGLHWELDSPDPLWPGGDVIASAWDPACRCVRIALKSSLRVGGLSRRAFRTASWAAGKAAEPLTALVPDDYDDLAARSRGFNSADYYGVALMPTPGPTFGFLWNFRHQLPLGWHDSQTFCYGASGRVDLSVVYQIERGGRWLHVPGRPDWLCAEEAPAWGRGALYTASSPLDVGDETWLYFTGTVDRHGWYGHQGDRAEWYRTVGTRGGFARIGLAKWPRDRIIGCEALLREVLTLRPGTAAHGKGRFVLNASIRPGGSVRAQLVDAARRPIAGYRFDDCETAPVNLREIEVRWKGRDGLPRLDTGRSIKAQVEIVRGTVYAFDFVLAA